MVRFCLALFCGSLMVSASAWAAQPVELHANNAGELAALCGTDPTQPASDAKINFCHGFAQGVISERLRAGGEKRPFCLPNNPPSRAATMREFVGWVRAAPANRDLPSPDAILKFFAERFPCKP